MAPGGDLDGDGDEDLLVAATLGNRACALLGPVAAGSAALDARDVGCLTGEDAFDSAGYGLAEAGDLDGDGVGDLLVGSPGHAEEGQYMGRAYLVLGPVTAGSVGLGEAAHASWSGSRFLDYLGITVVVVGDLTGDGETDLALGAPGYDGEAGGGGRAYVVAGPVDAGEQELDALHATVTGLSEEAGRPPPPHGALGTGDFVGDAIAGEADYDGDGQPDLALGATGDGTNGSSSGKAAVFFGPISEGDCLVSDADRTWYGVAANAYTGSPLVAAPDLDGDGKDELIVAADGLGVGVVYLLKPTEDVDSVDDAETRFEGVADGDYFGFGLARPGDLDGDGTADLAIGAPRADGDVPDAGAAYVFAGPFEAGSYAASDATFLPGVAQYDSFGGALDIGGDLDGDGVPDLAIGARDSDAGGSFSGAIYLFDLMETGA